MTPENRNSEIPKFIYRYRPVSTHSLGELASSNIWLSSVEQFNDPFEFQFELAMEDSSLERLYEYVANDHGFDIETVRQVAALHDKDQLKASTPNIPSKNLLNKMVSRQGVCCFSSILNSVLMWGHYAASHTGFVIEYDTEKDHMFDSLLPVTY